MASLCFQLEVYKLETREKPVPVCHSFMSDMGFCKYAFCFVGVIVINNDTLETTRLSFS